MATVRRPNKGRGLVRFPKDFTLIDLETTGMSPDKHEIIEIGALKVRDLEIVEEYSALIKPSKAITARVTNINGITNEMLEDKLTITEHVADIAKFLEGELIVGHGANLDVNFLYDNFENHHDKDLTNDFVDSTRLARKHLTELDSHDQANLIAHFNVETTAKKSSLNDCKMMLEVYKHMFVAHAPESQVKKVKTNLVKQPISKVAPTDSANDVVTTAEETKAPSIELNLDGERLKIPHGKKVFLIKSQAKADREEVIKAFLGFAEPVWQILEDAMLTNTCREEVRAHQRKTSVKLVRWINKYHANQTKENLEIAVASKIFEEFSDEFNIQARSASYNSLRLDKQELGDVLEATFNELLHPFLITLLVNNKVRAVLEQSMQEIGKEWSRGYQRYNEAQAKKWAVMLIIETIHKNLEREADKTSWNNFLGLN